MRAQLEDSVVLRLREVIAKDVQVNLLAERGFADHKFFALLANVRFASVVRIHEKTQIRDAQREAKCWILGRAWARRRMLRNARLTENKLPIDAFVCVRKPKTKEPWCLVSCLTACTGPEVEKSTRAGSPSRNPPEP